MKKNRIKKDSSLLVIIIGTLSIIFAQISENYYFNAGIFIAYSMILLWALYATQKDLLFMVFFLLSDNRIFDIGGISIQLVLMFIYIVKFNLLKTHKIYSSIFYSCCVYIVYSFIYFNTGLTNVLQGFKFSLIIIFYTQIFSEKNFLKKKLYMELIRISVMGVIISIICSIAVNPLRLFETGRFALSKDSNWNLLGILSALLFSHSILIYFSVENKKYLWYAIFSVVCVLITTSRTALLLVVISAVWVFLFNGNITSSFAKKCIFLTIVLILLVFYIIGIIDIPALDKVIDRILNPRQGDISNGRFTLWEQYIKYLSNNYNVLLFGYGGPLIEGIMVKADTDSLVAHNMFIEQIVSYGIVGNVIIIAMYMFSYKIIKNVNYSKGNNKIMFCYLLNILNVFIAGMFSHLITSVLVTSELYLGIVQYLVFSKERGNEED